MSDGITPWIGVDLDGTLAFVGGHIDMHFMIGMPIPKMVHEVRRLLEAGHDVRIFTARMCENPDLWQ